MDRTKALGLLRARRAEREAVAARLVELDEEVEKAVALAASARDVDVDSAFEMLRDAPDDFLSLGDGRIAFRDDEDARTFVGRAALNVVRYCALGRIGVDAAGALLDRLEALAAFESVGDREVTVPYGGGPYRAGLLGYMLLRPWDTGVLLRHKDHHKAAARAIAAAGEGGAARMAGMAALAAAIGAARPLGGDVEGLARLLAGRAPDIDLATRDGMTPLVLAVRNDWSPAVVSVLLEHGADPFLADMDGQDALSHARAAGRDELAALLLEHGADRDPERAARWRAVLDQSAAPGFGV